MKLTFEAITDKTSIANVDGAIVTACAVSPQEYVLIDSGAKYSPALAEYFIKNEMKVSAIIHTHLHTDHIANDRELMRRFGCQVYSGTRDMQTMSSKRLIMLERGYVTGEYIDEAIAACRYPMTPIPEASEYVEVCGEKFGIIPLPGHSIGHIGIVTPDGVCCLGDALLSPGKLEHMKLPYHADTGKMLASIKKIAELDYPFFVIAHEELVSRTGIRNTAEINLAVELKILGQISEIMNEALPKPVQPSAVLQGLGIANLTAKRREIVEFSAKVRMEYIRYRNFR